MVPVIPLSSLGIVMPAAFNKDLKKSRRRQPNCRLPLVDFGVTLAPDFPAAFGIPSRCDFPRVGAGSSDLSRGAE
jgi:hypothetical protein